ncbi:MAG: hypothetical protein WDA59_02275 [Methanofastidiosum sp.]|jgi:septation ring formation regulator EzrA|nr:hypothetical protein [Bacteroidales bacterium]
MKKEIILFKINEIEESLSLIEENIPENFDDFERSIQDIKKIMEKN